MELWEIVLYAGLAAIVIAAASAGTLLMIYARRGAPSDRPRRSRAPAPSAHTTVTLDIRASDPADPRVDRLIADACDRLFRATPSLTSIAFRDANGVDLGTRMRPSPKDVTPPPMPMTEPHTASYKLRPSRFEAQPETSTDARSATARFLSGRRDGRDVPRDVPASPELPIAQLYDLSPEVMDEITDQGDPVDLVRAILVAGGMQPHIDEDTLVVGEDAIIVLRGSTSIGSSSLSLNHAYYRFKASGARRGVAIALGPIDAVDARRREAMEPNLIHVKAGAIQRMADAAALGGNPIAFARGPVGEPLAG